MTPNVLTETPFQTCGNALDVHMVNFNSNVMINMLRLRMKIFTTTAGMNCQLPLVAVCCLKHIGVWFVVVLVGCAVLCCRG